MKKILVIGATGQIGSELTMKLRGVYGNDNVVAGYITGAEPNEMLRESGPCEICDVTDAAAIAAVVAGAQHRFDLQSGCAPFGGGREQA